MPNTIRLSLSDEVELLAELAIDSSQKQALQEIAQTLSVRSPATTTSESTGEDATAADAPSSGLSMHSQPWDE